MKIILSTLVLFAFLHHAVAQIQSLDKRKHFEYTDTSFEVGEVKIQCCIYFGFDGPDLREESFVHLDSVVDFLYYRPELSIEIGSHTDNKGNDKYNLKLSQFRSQYVVDYLANKGIDAHRITAKGYGESLPIAPNEVNGKDYPEGRQLNRRTEIKIISIESQKNFLRPLLLNPNDQLIHFLFGEKAFAFPLSLFQVRSIETIIFSTSFDSFFLNNFKSCPRSYLGFIDATADTLVMVTPNFSSHARNQEPSVFTGDSFEVTGVLFINLSKRICLNFGKRM